MIDWTLILSVIIGMGIGGGGASLLTYIFFRKQVQKKEDSDVIKQDASAAKEMLEFAQSMSDFKDGVIKNLQGTITKQNEIISNKDSEYRTLQCEMEDNKKQIRQLSLTQSEHERKIKGIANTLKMEIGKKQYAEHHLCVDKECKDRRPALGTFKTDNPKIFE